MSARFSWTVFMWSLTAVGDDKFSLQIEHGYVTPWCCLLICTCNIKKINNSDKSFLKIILYCIKNQKKFIYLEGIWPWKILTTSITHKSPASCMNFHMISQIFFQTKGFSTFCNNQRKWKNKLLNDGCIIRSSTKHLFLKS